MDGLSYSHAVGTQALPRIPPTSVADVQLLSTRPHFAGPTSRVTFESSLERVRQDYRLLVYGYVVMPEHVHLLVSEPERDTLARAMQSLKQSVARRLALRVADLFWQPRYYDFNGWSEMKLVDRLHSPEPPKKERRSPFSLHSGSRLHLLKSCLCECSPLGYQVFVAGCAYTTANGRSSQ